MNIKKSAIKIIKRLQKNGYQAVFAGGAIRDMLLGKTPHDYDIATSATPDQVEALFKYTKSVGKAFGVILIRVNGVDFEVATFRSDGDYTDGRRPNSVTFSTMEEDAKRRDFTCNALFYDPIADKIYDFVGGQDDIKNKILRFVGNPDDRIDEDKLRILRFIRFAIKLEFPTVDFLSYTAVRGNGINIKQIAPERIREEIVKCLEYRHPHSFLHLLIDTHILWYIFPDIAMLENEEQDPKWHPEGNALIHTFRALELVRDESYIIKLATLFHDVGKPATHKVVDGRITTRGHHKVGADITRKALEELRFSNEEIEHICWLVYNHMVNPIKLKTSKLKKLLAHPYIEDLIKVMRADKASSHGDTSHADFLEKKLNEWTPEEIKPSPLVTGHDLIELGFKPGPLFKEILNEVVDLQLENKINNKEEAIGHIKRKFQTNMSI